MTYFLNLHTEMKMVFKYICFFATFLCAGSVCFAQKADTSSIAGDIVIFAEEADSIEIKDGSPEKSEVPLIFKDKESLLAQARMLYENYKFEDALELYEKARKVIKDSLELMKLEDAVIMTQNSISMMDFCSTPVVVAKQRFLLKDFFQFYPLGDGSWRPVPNQLDTIGNGSLVKAMYIPEGAQTIYYSVKDENDIRNICKTEKQDTVWSVPELLGENMTTSSDEVFPMLSADGKSLYFSSEGLYGMGGYDLYVSHWDEDQNEWGVPVNLGFPYSSPFDDYLYIDTPDGKYSMFASNRECSEDSVYIYVLEYDSTPIRSAISDPEELKTLSMLDPVEDITRMDNGSTVDHNQNNNEDLSLYTEKLNQVRALSDSLSTFTLSIDDARNRLAETAGEEKEALIELISEKEMKLPVLQQSLKDARKEVQDIEMQFLMGGVVIDPDQVRKEAELEVVGASSSYTFTKNNMGRPVEMEVLVPEPEFDYSFKILPEGCFAESNELPDGIVYQIQLFASGSKATVRNLKGLSPVFEKKKNGSTYVYSVCVFRSYKDVLDKLNKVKKRGFRSAFITAYIDGKPVSVKTARTEENNVRHLYSIRIYPADGVSLSESELALIKVLTTSDLLKTSSEGIVSYLLGPFEDKDKTEKLLSEMKAGGFSSVSIESMTQKN